MSTTERITPTPNLLEKRRGFLLRIKQLVPTAPKDYYTLFLENGNKKTGTTGSLYKTILVWNLPAVLTCPGASEWCLSNCYNADIRDDIFPINRWLENLWIINNFPDVFYYNIIKQLSETKKSCAVRIHSSGDFFSKEYIKLWIDIINKNRDVHFWAYTRSFNCKELKPYLKELYMLDNMQLFLSFDKTIQVPNTNLDWRRSYVYNNIDEADAHSRLYKKGYIICPQQINHTINCASCGFCIKNINKDILFFYH